MKILRFAGTPYEHYVLLPFAQNWTEQDWLNWAGNDQAKTGIYREYLALIEGFTPEQLAEFWTETEPVLQAVPDWQGFMDRLDRPEAKPGGTGLYDALYTINPSIASTAHLRCTLFKDLGGSFDDIRFLNFLYLQLTQNLSPEQLSTLQTAISDFNIPIQI